MIVLHDVSIRCHPTPVALGRPLSRAVLPVDHELVRLRAERWVMHRETVVRLDREVAVVHPDEVTALMV